MRTKFLINGDYQEFEEIIKKTQSRLSCSCFKHKTWYSVVMHIEASSTFSLKFLKKILFWAFIQIWYLTSISNALYFIFIVTVIKYKETTINGFTSLVEMSPSALQFIPLWCTNVVISWLPLDIRTPRLTANLGKIARATWASVLPKIKIYFC